MPNLKTADKTNVNAVEAAITAAINGLDPTDRVQAGTIAVLNKMRRQLEMIRIERGQ